MKKIYLGVRKRDVEIAYIKAFFALARTLAVTARQRPKKREGHKI
jgi:hypothetical protein